jgi:branched-chain amino acid transport system ATP-binding protein
MSAQSILSVRGVSRSFRGLKAVNEVSFEVPRGSICSLIGPNGAGKSTFFNLVTGYFAPDSGTITFEGRDITGFSPVQVAHSR